MRGRITTSRQTLPHPLIQGITEGEFLRGILTILAPFSLAWRPCYPRAESTKMTQHPHRLLADAIQQAAMWRSSLKARMMIEHVGLYSLINGLRRRMPSRTTCIVGDFSGERSAREKSFRFTYPATRHPPPEKRRKARMPGIIGCKARRAFILKFSGCSIFSADRNLLIGDCIHPETWGKDGRDLRVSRLAAAENWLAQDGCLQSDGRVVHHDKFCLLYKLVGTDISIRRDKDHIRQLLPRRWFQPTALPFRGFPFPAQLIRMCADDKRMSGWALMEASTASSHWNICSKTTLAWLWLVSKTTLVKTGTMALKRAIFSRKCYPDFHLRPKLDPAVTNFP